MKKTLVYPANHPSPRGAYSPGLLVEHDGSSTLYVTGQLAVDRDGKVVAPFDATAQTEFVFQLIGSIPAASSMDPISWKTNSVCPVRRDGADGVRLPADRIHTRGRGNGLSRRREGPDVPHPH